MVSREELMKRAQAASRHAYAPYSKLHVGAAVLTPTCIYEGANFENDSYGATICAERSAIAHAIAHEGPLDKKLVILRVALFAQWDTSVKKRKKQLRTVSPCGICRQVLYQFAPDAPVDFLINNTIGTRRVRSLLKDPFEFVPKSPGTE